MKICDIFSINSEKWEEKRMKRLKKAAVSIAAGIMALMLSSCMALEQGLEFTNDGKVEVYAEISIEEDLLTSAKTTKEDFFTRMEESEDVKEYEGWDRENIEKTVEGKSHIGARYYKSLSYTELNEMKTLHEDKINTSYSITETDNSINTVITIVYPGKVNDSEIGEYIVNGMIKPTFVVKTPYEIIDTNGEKSADGTTVTWDIVDVMAGTVPEKVLTVSMKKEVSGFSAGVIIALCAAFIIPVGALVIILIATRKPSAPEKEELPPIQTYSQPEPVYENIAEAPAAEEAVTAETTEEPTAEEEIINERRYCRNCGNLTEKEDKFCTNCGEKLNR